jgi:hypothetical protein
VKGGRAPCDADEATPPRPVRMSSSRRSRGPRGDRGARAAETAGVMPGRSGLDKPSDRRWVGRFCGGRVRTNAVGERGIGVSDRVRIVFEALVVVIASTAELAGPAAADVGDDGEEVGPARSAVVSGYIHQCQWMQHHHYARRGRTSFADELPSLQCCISMVAMNREFKHLPVLVKDGNSLSNISYPATRSCRF